MSLEDSMQRASAGHGSLQARCRHTCTSRKVTRDADIHLSVSAHDQKI